LELIQPAGVMEEEEKDGLAMSRVEWACHELRRMAEAAHSGRHRFPPVAAGEGNTGGHGFSHGYLSPCNGTHLVPFGFTPMLSTHQGARLDSRWASCRPCQPFTMARK